MSYTVAICLPPVPDADAEAWARLDALIDEQGPVPPVFHELITRLTARYPCICDLPDDQVDDGVWSDGPLRNNAGHTTTVLGIVYSRVEDVLPFLTETANSLGLVVFDWATGLIHRGGSPRQVIAAAGAPPVPGVTVQWKKSAVLEQLLQLVAPAVAGHNFKFQKSARAFVRKIPLGRQTLGVAFWDYSPRFEFSLVQSIRIDPVEKINNQFSGSPPQYHSKTETIVTQLEYLCPDRPQGPAGIRWIVTTEPELADALTDVRNVVEERVVPFFDRHRDLESIDRTLNADLEPTDASPTLTGLTTGMGILTDRYLFSSGNHPYRAMSAVTIAHLARNATFDKLVARYRRELLPFGADDKDKFNRLVEHLSKLHR